MALGHPSVKSMLEHVSSRELSQWMAYEKVSGPIGPLYSHAALRQIACLLNGDEKARPFPSPAEMANYRPPDAGSSQFLMEE